MSTSEQDERMLDGFVHCIVSAVPASELLYLALQTAVVESSPMLPDCSG